MTTTFKGSFTQQEPIPDEAIEAALKVLRHGRLHRYNLAGDEPGETALLEEEFAAAMGAKYCLAVSSGGYAMATALRAIGVRAGDKVLSNAFTLAPVPGAIAGLGAVPVLVEVTGQLTLDLDDLTAKIGATGARVLLLSHMRGHICDMGKLMAICDGAGVAVIEDCAHTMGAAWRGTPSGRHGLIGCYSTQTYKHLNSGEGGLLITDDAEVMARAVMLSGSYMHYGRHRAAPGPEAFEDIRYQTPNMSGRMDNLRAAILRPQLRDLERQCRRWTERYRVLEQALRGVDGLDIIERPGEEHFVGSSFQFLLSGWPAAAVRRVVERCALRGVELKWFGAEVPAGFTSRYDSWRYAEVPTLPQTDAVLAGLVDMRVPLTFSLDDYKQIAAIIAEEVSSEYQSVTPKSATSR